MRGSTLPCQLTAFIDQWPHQKGPLSSGEWKDFFGRVWEQSAATLPRPAALNFDDRDLLAALRKRLMAPTSDGTVRLVVDGEDIRPIPSFIVPDACDKEFTNYLQRVDKGYEGRQWSLCVFRLHQASESLWRMAGSFLAGLYAELRALPSGAVDVDIFLGRYVATPVGVHTDHAANFMLSVHGEKRMALWDPAELPERPENRTPTGGMQFDRSMARVFTATTNNIVYMPSSWYHVGESPERATASLNIALFYDVPALDFARDIVLRRIDGLIDEFGLHQSVHLREGLSSNCTYSAMLSTLQRLLSPTELEDEFIASLLRRLTGYGLGAGIPLRSVARPRNVESYALEALPICAVARESNRLIIACNGRSARIEDTGAIARIVADLNARGYVRIAEYQCDTEDRALVEVVLDLLFKWGVVRALDG